MLMQALKAWFNRDHEGQVIPGQRFEATEYRARELSRAGLAIPVASETTKIRVVADPPKGAKAALARVIESERRRRKP
jgi:hypothetical protein